MVRTSVGLPGKCKSLMAISLGINRAILGAKLQRFRPDKDSTAYANAYRRKDVFSEAPHRKTDHSGSFFYSEIFLMINHIVLQR